MAKYLSECTSNKDNNLNLLRFLASSLVIFSHSYPLTGNVSEPLHVFGLSFGHIAVDIFFIISGFLITQSLIFRKNVGFFIYCRIIRIYPALIAAISFCVFGVGLTQTSLDIGEYLRNSQIYSYLFYNSILFIKPIHYALPGVFESNPYPIAVNGSLWTLPWEIKMYGALAALGLLTFTPRKILKLKYLKRIIVLIGISAMIFYLFSHLNSPSEGHYSVRFTAMFFVGGSFFIGKKIIQMRFDVFLACIIALLMSLLNLKLFYITYSILIPFLTLYIAYIPGGFVRLFNHLGDYSYGMYIYAFPVQQLVAKFIPDISVLHMFTLSWGLTLLLATLSWHFLEKRILQRKKDYFQIETGFNRLFTK